MSVVSKCWKCKSAFNENQCKHGRCSLVCFTVIHVCLNFSQMFQSIRCIARGEQWKWNEMKFKGKNCLMKYPLIDSEKIAFIQQIDLNCILYRVFCTLSCGDEISNEIKYFKRQKSSHWTFLLVSMQNTFLFLSMFRLKPENSIKCF